MATPSAHAAKVSCPDSRDCALSSPGDVNPERQAITEAVEHWNAQVGKGLDVRVELVKWESHSAPDLGGHPQAVLNEQLLKDLDLCIAVFWHRIGTKTEKYESGAVEEIEELRAAGTRVMLYFCERAIPQDGLVGDQYARLQAYKGDIRKQGLYHTYTEISQLREKVILHLTQVVAELLARDRLGGSSATPSPAPAGSAKPDIRVVVSGGLVTGGMSGKMDKAFVTTVQNHSDREFFLQTIFFRLKDKRTLLPFSDSFTGQQQQRRVVAPGDSFSLNVRPEYLVKDVDVDDIETAVARDAVGREFEADAKSVQESLKSILDLD